MKWAYGVTTVPERRHDLLPQTLKSLARAGFDKPRLFVDGCWNSLLYSGLDLPMTLHYPMILPFGNWHSALLELYLREPHADRYAIFQDDLLCVSNLKDYLERCRYPDGPENPGYWNLLTLRSNWKFVKDSPGWHLSNQYGRGALGLVFSLPAVRILLTSPHMHDRVQDPKRGWRAIDGGVVDAIRKGGGFEYVHNPSLVQHTGIVSAMDKNKDSLGKDQSFEKYVWEEGSDGCHFPGEVNL